MDDFLSLSLLKYIRIIFNRYIIEEICGKEINGDMNPSAKNKLMRGHEFSGRNGKSYKWHVLKFEIQHMTLPLANLQPTPAPPPLHL